MKLWIIESWNQFIENLKSEDIQYSRHNYKIQVFKFWTTCIYVCTNSVMLSCESGSLNRKKFQILVCLEGKWFCKFIVPPPWATSAYRVYNLQYVAVHSYLIWSQTAFKQMQKNDNQQGERISCSIILLFMWL